MRGLLFRSALAIEDFQWLFEKVITPELLERTRALMGMYLALGNYGIVDQKDAAVVAASDTSRPLRVTLNVTNSLTVDVSVGMGFAASGELLYTTQQLIGVVPSTLAVGSILVVSLKKTDVLADTRATDFPAYAVPTYRTRPGDDPGASIPLTEGQIAEAERDLIEFLPLVDYTALLPEDKAQRIVLTVLTITDGPVLNLDNSRAVYAFNRPWFSAVDIAHRSRVGGGLVTDENPHGTKLSGAAVADGVTALQLWTPEGMVVARDNDYAKIPGFNCFNTVPVTQLIEDDAGGSISGVPAVGGVRTRLIMLPHYPVRLLRVVATGVLTGGQPTEIAGFLIPGYPLVAIPPHEVQWLSSGDIQVTTTAVSAGEPPTGDLVAGTPPRVGANLTKLLYTQPVVGRRELLISRGREFSAIASPLVSLLDYGTIPINGRAFMDQLGDVQLLPQPLCQLRLDPIGSTAQTIGKTFVAPGRLRCALTGAAPGPAMQIQIQFQGLDPTGSTLQETVTFLGTTWMDNPAPSCQELGAQFGSWGTQNVSQNVWASITSFQVILRANDGLNSAIVVYLDPDSVEDELNDSCPLSTFTWDGTKTCDHRDDRPVSLFGVAPHSSPIIAEGNALLASRQIVNMGFSPPIGSPTFWYIEDFREPRYMDATQSTLDRAFDGCRGRTPDGILAKGTYVTRALPVRLDVFGVPVTSTGIIIYPVPFQGNVEGNLSRCVAGLQLRVYQGQAGGVWPGAPISIPAPYFGVLINASSVPALPNGNFAINRLQVLLTTSTMGNLIKGLVIAVVSA